MFWHIHDPLISNSISDTLVAVFQFLLPVKYIVASSDRALAGMGLLRRSPRALIHAAPQSPLTPSPEALADVQRRFGLTTEDRILLAVGRLQRHKGFDILLHAMHLIVNCVPSVKLVLVGSDLGNLETAHAAELYDLAADPVIAPHVVLAGFCSDAELGALYHLCEIFVHPARVEFFGLVIVEAMLSAKPVVTTRSGGPQTIVREDETGHLVEPENVEGLAMAIVDLLNDPDRAKSWGRQWSAARALPL